MSQLCLSQLGITQSILHFSPSGDKHLIELCKIIGINRTYLSNYINNTYGLNFNLWINHLRIEEAKQLMGQTPKRSLSEIAERIGFTDLAHFSKQFKLQEGVSPSEWRKNM